jgi:hypothetical protein
MRIDVNFAEVIILDVRRFMAAIIDRGCRLMEWVSVKERKPDLYKEVLLFSQHERICLGCYMGHKTYSIHSWGYPVLGQCKPTRWMELPDPPKLELIREAIGYGEEGI